MSDWEVQRNDRSSGRICYEIVEIATGVRIAELDDDLNPAAKEDAALIVRAVRAHEGLLAQLEWFATYPLGKEAHPALWAWKEHAHAAIKAATGETGL